MANPITQADAGSSLAKIYDTVGSSSGSPNAEIEADRILLVHEMGAVLASERYLSTQRLINSGNLAQSTTFEVLITGLAIGPARLCNLYVALAPGDASTNFQEISVNLRNPDSDDEIPWFAWDAATGQETVARFDRSGVGGTRVLLLNQLPFVEPLINGALGVPNCLRHLALRGTTTAFGAGTVNVQGGVRVVTMGATAGFSGSYGLPLYW